MGDERCLRADARGSASGLGAGVAAADHDHIEGVAHGVEIAGAGGDVKAVRGFT